MLVGDEKFRVHAFLVMALLFATVGAILVGVSELSRQFSPELPLVLYSLSFALAMYVILTYITANDRKIVRFIATGGSEIILAMLLVSMIAATVLFGLVCKEVHYTLGTGFSGDLGPNPLLWIGFGFDNLFEALFLDVPNVYRMNMTNIQADTFWTQTLVLLFRSAANLLIIRAVVRYWEFLRSFMFSRRL